MRLQSHECRGLISPVCHRCIASCRRHCTTDLESSLPTVTFYGIHGDLATLCEA